MPIYLLKLDQVHVAFNFDSPAQTHFLRINACSVCPVPWQMAPSLVLVKASIASQHSRSQESPHRTRAAPNADHFVAPPSCPWLGTDADMSLHQGPSQEAPEPTLRVARFNHSRAPFRASQATHPKGGIGRHD